MTSEEKEKKTKEDQKVFFQDNESRPIPDIPLEEEGFGYALNEKELIKLQDAAQKRSKKELFREMQKNSPSKEQAVLALYCHTAYELGVMRGMMDADHILEKMFKEREETNDKPNLQNNKQEDNGTTGQGEAEKR